MTLALTDVQRSLGLFAESLSGHVVRIEALDDGQLGWPWNLSLPDPAVIRLAPALHADAASESRRHYRAQVLHHLAMIEFGTYGDDPEHLDHEAAPQHRIIALESASAIASLAAKIVVLTEHLRIIAKTRWAYPGAEADLDGVLGAGRDVIGEGSIGPGAPGHGVIGAGLIGALRLRCLGASTDEIARRCPAVDPELLARLLSLTEPLQAEQASLDDSARAAVEIAKLLTNLDPSSPSIDGEPFVPTVDDAEDTEPDPRLQDLEGMSTSPPPLDAEADRVGDDLEGSVQSSPISFAAEVKELESSTAKQQRRPPHVARHEVSAEERTFMYDEWNYIDESYKRSWCRVVERHLVGDDHDFLADVHRRHAALRGQIRRQFARLRPEERVRMYRRDDGEELDLDAVIEAIVDRRSGVAADDRLTIRREPAARDVATAFLVDLSASTSSPSVEPEPTPWDDIDLDDPMDDPFFPRIVRPDEPPIRRVIDVAKDAVALMCDALDQLGDRHSVYGFSGQGRHAVEFRVGKEFDVRPSSATWSAIAAMEPISYTRMGPAVRHAAAKLSNQDARTKLLIVISDGYPQDIDYGPDRRDKTYGVHDTAKAIVEAGQAGVDTFCVTIDPAGHDYLRVMSPDHRYLVIDDVESLPAELAKLYLSLAR